MPPRLYAARYANDMSSPALLEFIEEPADVGIRWSLPFGLQRAELVVKSTSRFDAYNRYQSHQGQRIVFPDSYLDKPVCGGWVYEVQKDGRFVHYIMGGPFYRHKDKFYERSDMPASGDTDAHVKDVLADVVSVTSTDQTNIDATSTDIGSWEPYEYGGELASDIIPHLALMSDAGGDIWDYWLECAAFNAVTLDPPVAYFEERSASAAADWIIDEGDLAPRGLRLARHIWDLKRKVTVYYGKVTATHDGGNNSADLIDSSENFAEEGVRVGDMVSNTTDGSRGRVVSIEDDGAGNEGAKIVVELSGGTDDDFDTGDAVVIHLSEPRQAASAATSSETDLWGSQVPEFIIKQLNMDATQANQFAKMLVGQFEKIVQQQAFTIGSPYIRHKTGAKRPLWEVIKQSGGYIRADIYPTAALLSLSLDRLQSFKIVAMDYNYRRNRLRIVPDTEDSRLDVILKRGKLIQGEIVAA